MLPKTLAAPDWSMGALCNCDRRRAMVRDNSKAVQNWYGIDAGYVIKALYTCS